MITCVSIYLFPLQASRSPFYLIGGGLFFAAKLTSLKCADGIVYSEVSCAVEFIIKKYRTYQLMLFQFTSKIQ